MTVDIWVSLIAGVGFFLTALYVAIARRNRPTWILGVILLFFCSELTFAHALQNLSSDLTSRIFWYKMTHLGFTVTPTAFFCFALHLSGFGRWFTPRTRLLLSIFPALTAGLIFTNEMHGLVWKSALTAQIVNSTGFLSVTNAGIWYWIFLVYSYLMMGGGFFFIAWLVARSQKFYRWQSVSFFIAGLLATLGATMDVLGLSPLPSFSATALGFAIGTITVALVLTRIRRRDLVSVSRTTIINSISDSIIVVDVYNQIVDLNPSAEKLLGKRLSNTVGKPIDQLLPALAMFCDSQSDNITDVMLDSDNMRHTLDVRVSAIKDWRGHIVSKVIVLRDITERMRAQEDIRRVTEGAHAIFWRSAVTKSKDETAGAGGFIWDTYYLNLDKVDEFLPLQTHPSNNLKDMFYYSQLEEDRIAMDLHSAAALRSGVDEYNQEFRIRDANGVIHWMYENARILRLSDTQFEINGFMIDITQLKSIEEALRESETRLSIFFNYDPTGILIVDRKTRIIQDVNPSALESLGVSKEHVIGKQCHVFLCSAEAGKCPICDLGQIMDHSEQVLIKPGGIRVPIQKTIVPIKINGEDCLFESFIDVTQRKEAEKKILASIVEKEALLKEIHHRVKNNLQIISSLMDLQANQIKDEHTIGIFRDCQSRIQSMALIHEKLYRSENVARIRFDKYLKELANSIIQTYSDSSRNICLQVNADPVHMDIDTAVPCGLIVNELITNSLKHAFRETTVTSLHLQDTISIQLCLEPENKIVLIIADNGEGFPADVDFRNTDSLGLRLVNILTCQLNGEVNFSNHHGAQIEVSFISKSAYVE